MTTEAQKKAQKKWDEANRENRRSIRLNLNRKTDADIIERLEKEPNIQGYIKNLIRSDMGL